MAHVALEATVELGSSAARAAQAAEAIMTSDTRPKQIAVEFQLGGKVGDDRYANARADGVFDGFGAA